MYLLLGWSVPVTPETFRWFDGLAGLGGSPVSALLILAVFGVTYGFARPPDKWVRTSRKKMGAKSVMGLAHTILHGLSFTTVMWLAMGICHALTLDGWSLTALSLVLVAILGAGFGSVSVGAYLALCCAAFRAHGNEAFSAMSRTDYKNFLRLHIDTDGVLTVYPLGIRKVTRTSGWRLDPHNLPGASWLAPASAADTPTAHFIEPPFTIDGRARHQPDAATGRGHGAYPGCGGGRRPAPADSQRAVARRPRRHQLDHRRLPGSKQGPFGYSECRGGRRLTHHSPRSPFLSSSRPQRRPVRTPRGCGQLGTTRRVRGGPTTIHHDIRASSLCSPAGPGPVRLPARCPATPAPGHQRRLVPWWTPRRWTVLPMCFPRTEDHRGVSRTDRIGCGPRPSRPTRVPDFPAAYEHCRLTV